MNWIDPWGLKWEFIAWEFKEYKSQWTHYRWLIAYCYCDDPVDIEKVYVFYQQWRPIPINVPEIPTPDFVSTPNGSDVDSFFDLIEAIIEAKKRGDKDLSTIIMEESGQKYCDQLDNEKKEEDNK